MAVLMVLAVVMPALASASVSLKANCYAVPSQDAPSERSSDSGDQPELPTERSGTPTGPLVEEEVGHKAWHTVPLITNVHPGFDQGSDRIDRAYEAWFYFISHPPLTPPPNAA